MIKAGLKAFAGKNVLLLQGPVGPFFRRLALDLEANGAKVHKVNFNGGDHVFYPAKALSFRGALADWPDFFDQLLTRFNIDVVMLFGDCRAYHRVAHEIAQMRGVELRVFEEGYIRPDFITLEQFGANDNSLLPRESEHYDEYEAVALPKVLEVGSTFSYAAMWAMLYYMACSLLWPLYWRYQHHRPLNIFEGLYWVRSLWRKHYYAYVERDELKELITQYHKRYFLVPLQVHNDAQIYFHSNYVSVRDFIRHLIQSFASQAPTDTLLIIKHHPLDRGYHDYTKCIYEFAQLSGIENRVRYIHDLHLPTLFDHARGVVVVNSTAGLSALHHGLPVKVCGRALYNIAGLTFQGTVDQFWQSAEQHQIDKKLQSNFQNYLIIHTQLNGSFYKRLALSSSHSGIVWSK